MDGNIHAAELTASTACLCFLHSLEQGYGSDEGITRLLDVLERSGLVEKQRCDSDLRVTYAALTTEGVAKVEEARAMHLADIAELFGSNFDADEHATLAELLGRLPLAATSPACADEGES